MSKSSGVFDDIKKDFKNMYKHCKKAVKGLVGGNRHKDDDCCGNCCSGHTGRKPGFFGWPPFFKPGRSPWFYILLSPKMCVVWIMLLVLLFCGVSLYGLIVVILLGFIFILI